MYFRLNPECHFIKGEVRGAIYDLIDGKICSLDQKETKLIASCENNEPICDDEDLLRNLRDVHVGNMYNNKVYIKKLYFGSPSLISPEGSPPELQRAYLEINNSCNRNCWFCGYYGIKRSMGCMGCNKWKDNNESLTLKRWEKLLEELNDLGCKEIFLKGGDLTLSWNNTKSILDYAKDMFDTIYITLHKLSLSDSIVNDLDDKINIIIQSENLNELSSRSHAYAGLLTIKPEDWRNNKDAIGNVANKDIMVDFVIDDANQLVNNIKTMPKNMSLDVQKFTNSLKYHPCIGHTITITHSGDTIPCPMMRTHKLGNIKDKELYTIFENANGDIYKFWGLNLNNIEKCKVCEYRYACNDCRALEESLTGRLDGKVLCGYNPKNGEWR